MQSIFLKTTQKCFLQQRFSFYPISSNLYHKFVRFFPIKNDKIKSVRTYFQKKNFSSNLKGTCLSTHEEFEKIFNTNSKDFYVQQINTSCLSQFSYYIESNGEVAIIDPIRESDEYLKILEKRCSKLKYILETHFHADFVSGHLELSRHTGAQIIYGPNAESEIKIKIAKDGELLSLGAINIKVFHTPGHTLECSSYVLLDKEQKPRAIFTGDFLFLGDVGRPDLAVKGGISERDLAGMTYDSLKRLQREYSGDVLIFPGHGAGSACGKNISKGIFDTLSNQIKTNYALNKNLEREEFIEIVTSELPTPPQYFFHDVMLNKKGYENTQNILKASLIPIPVERFKEILNKDKNVVVIDNRDYNISKKLFLKGSYLISLKIQYSIWAAQLFDPFKQIIIITDKGFERESIVRLSRVGLDNVLGYLEGGAEAFKHFNNNELTSMKDEDLENIKSIIDNNLIKNEFYFVDVRELSEWKTTGIIANSHLYALSNLINNIEKLSQLSQQKPLGVYCRTGVRANIAGSILKAHGIENILLLGGTLNMIDKKVTFIKYGS